jgi:hypothetical protein
MLTIGANRHLSCVSAYHGPILAFSSLGILAGTALIISTPWGLGLSPDSAVYIGSARSLLQGVGFSLPSQSNVFALVVHYPPLYPALLAAVGFGGPDPLVAAKWFNGLLFAANIFIAGWLVFVHTKSILLSVYAAVLMMTALPMVQVHSMVWSEPLFALFELCGALFLISYFRTISYRYLIAAAGMVGLSAITRYAGVAFIASGIASILFLGNASTKKKFLHAGIFLVIASLPLVGWMARNWALTGSSANRSVSFHPMGLEHLTAVVTTMMSWISASWLSVADAQIALGISLFMTAALIFFLRKYRQDQRPKTSETTESVAFPGLMLSLILAYFLMLFATISFLDHQTPIDSRILSPVYAPIMLLGISLGSRLAGRRLSGKGFSRLALPIAFVLLGLQLASTWPWVALIHEKGVGYASREWRESDMVQRVKSVPFTTPMFSNAPDVLYTLLGRASDMIPRKTNPDTRAPNENYHAQLLAMKNQLKNNQGLLVYFDRVQWRWYLPSSEELQTALGLRLLMREQDGSIYRTD